MIIIMQVRNLRLKQQYFFVSASVQTCDCDSIRKDMMMLRKLYEKVTFQLNDTHPTVSSSGTYENPSLMKKILEWDEAWAYHNKDMLHIQTIQSWLKHLEKWPIELFSRLLPRIYQIVEEINRRFVLEIEKTKYPGNQDKIRKMAIIYDGQVKMAHLAICSRIFCKWCCKTSYRNS